MTWKGQGRVNTCVGTPPNFVCLPLEPEVRQGRWENLLYDLVKTIKEDIFSTRKRT